MKYLPIDSKLFKRNRSKFVSKMLPNSIAVFNSNDIFSTGADSTLPFYQHRNIFYLSGVDDSRYDLYHDRINISKNVWDFLTENGEDVY